MASSKEIDEQVPAILEGYHMEHHTTIISQHDIEVDQVKLTERKETTKVIDDNEVNMGKTVIKHIRSIKEPVGMGKEEDTNPSTMLCSGCCVHGRASIESVSETSMFLEPVEYVTQTITIYQKMTLMDNGEEVEGERSVETDMDDSEVIIFLEKWNSLWHPKVSDDQVQDMINTSLVDGHKEKDSRDSTDGSQTGSKQTDSKKEDEQEIPSDHNLETVEAGGLKVSTFEPQQKTLDIPANQKNVVAEEVTAVDKKEDTTHTGDTVMQKNVKQAGRPEHFL